MKSVSIRRDVELEELAMLIGCKSRLVKQMRIISVDPNTIRKESEELIELLKRQEKCMKQKFICMNATPSSAGSASTTIQDQSPISTFEI